MILNGPIDNVSYLEGWFPLRGAKRSRYSVGADRAVMWSSQGNQPAYSFACLPAPERLSKIGVVFIHVRPRHQSAHTVSNDHKFSVRQLWGTSNQIVDAVAKR